MRTNTLSFADHNVQAVIIDKLNGHFSLMYMMCY